MSRGFSWPTVGRLAALTAVYAIEHPGPQEHSYSLEQFVARYRENYGDSAEVESLLPGHFGRSEDGLFRSLHGSRSRWPRREGLCRSTAWDRSRSSPLPSSRSRRACWRSAATSRPSVSWRPIETGSSPGSSSAGRSSGGRRTLGSSSSRRAPDHAAARPDDPPGSVRNRDTIPPSPSVIRALRDSLARTTRTGRGSPRRCSGPTSACTSSATPTAWRAGGTAELVGRDLRRPGRPGLLRRVDVPPRDRRLQGRPGGPGRAAEAARGST